jgi:hypothetical protein
MLCGCGFVPWQLADGTMPSANRGCDRKPRRVDCSLTRGIVDRTFKDLVSSVNSEDTVVFSIGRNTTFRRDTDALIVRYESQSGQVVEHRMKNIEELVEGDAESDSSDDNWTDKYLPLLQAIETAIDGRYIKDPGLHDKTVLAVVDRLVQRPDIRMDSPLVDDIQANLRLILSTMKFSRKEVVGSLRKVQKSIRRHHSVAGTTGYLDFIRKSFATIAEKQKRAKQQ